MMTKEERAAIRARCDAATEGPWFAHESHNWHKDPPKEYYVITRGMNDIVTSWAETADAQFIANARTALPAALDDLDAKDAEIDRLQARCEALERANKRHAPCETCIYLTSSPYVSEASHYCDNCEWWRNGAKDLWQFDEARFRKEQS